MELKQHSEVYDVFMFPPNARNTFPAFCSLKTLLMPKLWENVLDSPMKLWAT